MSTPEGVRYLTTDDQLLVQIVKSFAQLDPVRLLVLSCINIEVLMSCIVQWCSRFRSNTVKEKDCRHIDVWLLGYAWNAE
jgi:hypothetical protein